MNETEEASYQQAPGKAFDGGTYPEGEGIAAARDQGGEESTKEHASCIVIALEKGT